MANNRENGFFYNGLRGNISHKIARLYNDIKRVKPEWFIGKNDERSLPKFREKLLEYRPRFLVPPTRDAIKRYLLEYNPELIKETLVQFNSTRGGMTRRKSVNCNRVKKQKKRTRKH